VGALPADAGCKKSLRPRLEVVAGLARELGKSVAQLQGWTPKTITKVHRDDDGRVIGWETFTESEWTTEQVDLLLASRELEQERGPHGVPMSEATDPANQFAYYGDEPITDWVKKAQLDKEDAYRKKHHSETNPVNMNGLIFPVKKRDVTG